MTEQPTHPTPLPPPESISEQAAEFLLGIAPTRLGGHPALDDVPGWERYVRALEEPLAALLEQVEIPEERLTRRLEHPGGVPTRVLVPAGVEEASAPLIIDLHGGGLIVGGGDLAWRMAAGRALAHAAVTWVPDYRMPPAHRFPSALDDCLAGYRAALAVRPAERIALLGASAGGNLAAALVHRLKEEGLPVPAALVLLSPELDLTESGDSFTTLLGLDRLSLLRPVNELYADGADLAHPHLSPLFGDLTGFPPTFLQSGTRDLFLSNTVRMHRRLLDAGVPVELRVMEAAPHGGFGGRTPEDRAIAQDVRRFLHERLRVPD